jgi:hypothetical protein
MDNEINNDECSICLDVINATSKIKLINCNHIFHRVCIAEWTKINNTCPLCRKNISNFFYVKFNSFGNGLFKKKIIAEVMENCIIFYNNIEELKNIEDINENISNLEINIKLDYSKIKIMKVKKNLLKINYIELNNSTFFKFRNKNIYLNNNNEAINLFNTIKENILHYHNKLTYNSSNA